MIKGQKYHILYKTTCVVTGKYYVGVHSTSNLDDDYLGSGKYIRNSIAKHGINQHRKEILMFFCSREMMFKEERNIVNEQMLADPLCMNLKRGGEGGMALIDKNIVRRVSAAGHKGMRKKMEDENYRKKHCIKLSISIKKAYKDNLEWQLQNKKNGETSFKGKKHTDETKQRISKTNSKNGKGSSNSQYGTMWVNNGIDSIRIKKELLDTHLDSGWSLGISEKFKDKIRNTLKMK